MSAIIVKILKAGRLVTCLALALALLMPAADAYAASQSKNKSKTTTSKTAGGKQAKSSKQAKGSSSKGTSAKGKGKAASGKSAKSASQKKGKRQETSADVKKQQEATNREIRQTEQQIKENEAAVKKNLNELGKLQGDIETSRKKVADAGAKVSKLQGKISSIQTQIASDEKSLAKMRAEYLKAVKKMRAKKRGNSTMAFVFSAGSFKEAMRRMRYLKEFSNWEEKQKGDIERRAKSLREQETALKQTKTLHDRELAAEVKAQGELKSQYDRQGAIVSDLKNTGDALRVHLARKQQEANALKGRVASLIAEEVRKAEAEQRAREEAEKKAQAAKAEAEKKAQIARAESEKAAKAEAEKTAKTQAARKAESERAAKELAQAEKKAQEQQKTQARQKQKEAEKAAKIKEKKETKQTKPKKEEVLADNGGNVTYAEARKRKPKEKPSASASESSKPSASASANVPKPTRVESAPKAEKRADSGFSSMKGALPRPVAGKFQVTSRFGRQTLPDMPSVSYDNPGIDAEVAAGATAQSVYAGKVSAVYMVPGYETVVIVNHDGYYTVYGNLSSASVKVGDSVKQGQALGRVAAGDDNPSQGSIHFEVWKNREKQDPLGWIR